MTPRPILNAKHYGILTAAFALFVIYGSLVPLEFRACSLGEAFSRYRDAITKPLSFTSRSDWAANVLLFIPLGFVAFGWLTVDRQRQSIHFALVSVLFVFSGLVEFLQIWFPSRTTSINDIVAETIGGMIGVGIWIFCGATLTHRIRAAWSNLEPGDWASKLLPAYLLLLVFVHGMPFDLSISPGEIWQKYQRGFDPIAVASGAPIVAVVPNQTVLPEKLLLCLVYFIPLGVLLARLPNHRWRTDDALVRVFGAGLLVAGAIEALQLIVLSCGTYASDVVCGTLSVVAGWKLATLKRGLPHWFWNAAGGGWCFALVVVRWMPFDWHGEHPPFNYIPFADYYASNYLGAFNRIFNVTALFIPIGFFLHLPNRQRIGLALAVGGLFSGGIEIGQTLFTTHQGSISDMLLGAVGCAMGAVIRARVPIEVPLPKPTPKLQATPKIVFYTGLR
jgi:glycopeptide antibiotics resistance protein